MATTSHSPLRIAIVGAGNVAWHIGHALKSQEIVIDRILNRTEKSGSALAAELNTTYSSSWDIPANSCDIVILAVSDTFLPEIVSKLNCQDTVVVHTAGSVPIDCLKGEFKQYGVLYPFQTLTKGVTCDFGRVPLFIEASDSVCLKIISDLASALSRIVREMSSIQRKKVHLAGVILNNFTNHLIARSSDYLRKNDLEVELIMPLLHETIDKLLKTSPYEAQTGPARRNDLRVLNEHLEMLSDEPELKNLYSLITDSIIAYYSAT